jgi:26S proteasome regulatory subunit N7
MVQYVLPEFTSQELYLRSAACEVLPSYLLLSSLLKVSGGFGVSVKFVDSELSQFITNGRLHCTIDKVHGIVETIQPSFKNSQYDKVIKQGDVLLNSIQRLNKVLY